MAYDRDTKEKVIREYIESMPLDSLKNKELLEMYLPYLNNVYTPQYEYVLKNLDIFQRKSNINRYDVEIRLQRTMADAVRNIVNTTLTHTNTDTLALMCEKGKTLKKMLQGANVKGFPELYAKLAVNEVRIERDIAALDVLLEADNLLQATRDEYSFRPAMYRYMIEFADHKTQKDIIRKYLMMIQQKQDLADDRSKGKVNLFTENMYDILAIGYSRLGDKKKGEEYAKKYDERYKLRLVDMQGLFKDEKMKAQMEEEYRRTIEDLYAKIGLKSK